MAFPPSDVSPSELWEKLLEVPAPSEVFNFPRAGADGRPVGQLRIMVLPHCEHDLARMRAVKRLATEKGCSKEELDTVVGQEILADAVACETLFAACVHVEPIKGSEATGQLQYAKIFPSAKAISEKLTADEIAVLWTAYRLTQERFGPTDQSMASQAQIEAWIARLVEGARLDPLVRLSWPALLQLTASLAQRDYTICAALASQRESLPSTLVAALETSGIGISSRTWLPVDCSNGLTIERPDNFVPEPDLLPTAEGTLTIDDAIEISERLHG